ncbi:MAG: ABC transporter permease [Actinobacteria bacterium]|nr:ABC transporter permease [Actinomycetota bacterium]
MTTTHLEVIGTGKMPPWRRWLIRHGWTLGVWLLLLALILRYSTLIPRFGSFEITSILTNGLPWVFLAVGQAVIVIAGGIDLGVGGLMVLANVAAARFMDGQPFEVTLIVAVLVLVGAAIINGLAGWIIHVSKVPDIVATLATLFIYQGLALAVLGSPGGGTSKRFRWLFTGSEVGIGRNPWPALVVLVVSVTIVALWMAKTRSGLELYAVGSNRNAAYLSGIRTARTKVVSYAIGGAYAALAGLAITAIAGRGNPNALGGNFTLNSVAAIVLGGVALTGGVGSVVGAVPAGIILFFLNPTLTAMGIDPNRAQIIQGLLIVLVMMVGGLLELRRQRRS